MLALLYGLFQMINIHSDIGQEMLGTKILKNYLWEIVKRMKR